MANGTHTADVAKCGHRFVAFDGIRVSTAIYRRSTLALGFQAEGPAIVEEPSATTLVPPGQRVEVDGFENLVISAA